MDDDVPRPLLTTAEVVRRIRVERTTVKRWARSGRIPGATKLESVWRFDPDAIERWIASGQPPQATGTPIPSPAAEHHERVAPAAKSTPLVVLFPRAAHRGINDQPAAGPAQTRRQRRVRR